MRADICVLNGYVSLCVCQMSATEIRLHSFGLQHVHNPLMQTKLQMKGHSHTQANIFEFISGYYQDWDLFGLSNVREQHPLIFSIKSPNSVFHRQANIGRPLASIHMCVLVYVICLTNT